MNPGLLQLHLTQAKRSLGKAANNNYLDPKKSAYQSNLQKLLSCLEGEDFGSLSANDKHIRKSLIDFVFNSIEYLDGSLFSTIPFELTYCLNHALENWITNGSEKFILTTALRPELFGFSLTSIADRFRQINALYGIDFKHDLIRISLSKYLAHDYLYNIVLYHELGHFVDRQHNISETYVVEFMRKLHAGFSPLELTSYQVFFPFLFDANGSILPNMRNHPRIRSVILSHLMEYFADLFAAQYVGECSHEILKYLSTPYTTTYSESHPSTDNRIKAVDDFLASTPNHLISCIKDIANLRANEELKIRYSEPGQDDFYHLIPPVVNNEEELHGIFSMAWKVYLGDHTRFQSENASAEPFTGQEVYQVINNLTEKSIGNYIAKKSFDEH